MSACGETRLVIAGRKLKHYRTHKNPFKNCSRLQIRLIPSRHKLPATQASVTTQTLRETRYFIGRCSVVLSCWSCWNRARLRLDKCINFTQGDSWTNRALLLADLNALWKLIDWNNFFLQPIKNGQKIILSLRSWNSNCVLFWATAWPFSRLSKTIHLIRQFVVIEIRNLKNNDYSGKKEQKHTLRTTKLWSDIWKWYMKLLGDFFVQFAIKRAWSTSLENGTSSFYWKQKPWVRIYLTDYNKART